MPLRVHSMCRARAVLRLPIYRPRIISTTATSPGCATRWIPSSLAENKRQLSSSFIHRAGTSHSRVEHEPLIRTSESSPSTLLSTSYVEDGIIPRSSNDALDGETQVPMWGAWGIPIRWRYRHPTMLAGQEDVTFYPHLWLRDNCRCSDCVNQDTMQRAFDTFSVPDNIIPGEVITEKAGLRVTWANDGHVSLYPWNWLHKYRLRKIDQVREHKEKSDEPRLSYWGSEIMNKPPSVHYDEIMADDKGVALWTRKIRKFGFCFVDGCPVSPEKTQELLERISFIRITHYGGFYDFTSDLTMKDTAYTSLALQAHTDTTYFTDPAGLQMFHLLSHTDGNGGASLLVDGFHAAATLAAEDTEAYETLCQTLVPWHASGNDGITIVPSQEFPVLNLNAWAEHPEHVNVRSKRSHSQREKMKQIRWNNDDRGTLNLHGYITGPKRFDPEKWYAAARKWNEILKRESMEYWAQLEPGRPLIFDNWRVLHGRSAFTGKRRICGGYINHDDFISRWRNTNFTREEVLAQIL